MANQANLNPLKDNNIIYGVYVKSLLTKKVILTIVEVGKNVKQNIEKKIMSLYEGRCIAEGFVRPKSTKVINYSSGSVNGDKVEFYVTFECMICNPVEGMLIKCMSKNITKAGIHAEVNDYGIISLTIFVARDHHYMDEYFNTIKENEEIIIKVIGVRFEINDPYICVIGKLMKPKKTYEKMPTKPKLKIIGGFQETELDEEDQENYEFYDEEQDEDDKNDGDDMMVNMPETGHEPEIEYEEV